MKIDFRTTKEMVVEAAISVSDTVQGDICMVIQYKGITKRCFMAPENAVKIWRCLEGELEECMVEYRTVPEHDAVCEKMVVVYDDISETWRVNISPVSSFTINADKALALVWAIEKSVGKAMSMGLPQKAPKTKEIALSPVWTLTSWRVLTGYSIAERSAPATVGGHVEAFSSKEKAEDRLREFMRPLVNDAYPADSTDGCETNVDDILDGIIEGVQHLGNSVWTRDQYHYEGTTQSFVVELESKDIDAVEI